jgi:hypothetical protein
VKRRSSAYTIIDQELYKRNVTGVLQRCVSVEKGKALLLDIHQGECGHHASTRSIIAKAFRHGFYWLSAYDDAKKIVKTCNGCQYFRALKHTPSSALKTIPITWPFAVWCLDMMGPFKMSTGGYTHLLVVVNKFTKWVEAKPVSHWEGEAVVKFFTDIIIRYGVPHNIITDNVTNFAQGEFAKWGGRKGIRLDLASVTHPMANGQVERYNGLILSGIRPRLMEPLERTAGCWVEELPSMLWSLRTTPNCSTDYTPFFLVYGSEAVLPADVEFDSPKDVMYTEKEAEEARQDGVDLLEEAR